MPMAPEHTSTTRWPCARSAAHVSTMPESTLSLGCEVCEERMLEVPSLMTIVCDVPERRAETAVGSGMACEGGVWGWWR